MQLCCPTFPGPSSRVISPSPPSSYADTLTTAPCPVTLGPHAGLFFVWPGLGPESGSGGRRRVGCPAVVGFRCLGCKSPHRCRCPETLTPWVLSAGHVRPGQRLPDGLPPSPLQLKPPQNWREPGEDAQKPQTPSEMRNPSGVGVGQRVRGVGRGLGSMKREPGGRGTWQQQGLEHSEQGQVRKKG